MKARNPRNMTRRKMLQTGAGLTVAGVLASGDPASAAPARANVYDSLGVQRVINAGGTFTNLGGSIMPPEKATRSNPILQ